MYYQLTYYHLSSKAKYYTKTQGFGFIICNLIHVSVIDQLTFIISQLQALFHLLVLKGDPLALSLIIGLNCRFCRFFWRRLGLIIDLLSR